MDIIYSGNNAPKALVETSATTLDKFLDEQGVERDISAVAHNGSLVVGNPDLNDGDRITVTVSAKSG